MPNKNLPQPKIGNLVRCRVSAGTFTYTATRRVIEIKNNGSRYVIEGPRSNPVIQRKDILAVLTTRSLTIEKQV